MMTSGDQKARPASATITGDGTHHAANDPGDKNDDPAASPDNDINDDAIKTMQLYTHMDRITRELAAQNLQHATDPELLAAVDSLHYGGVEAIREGLQALLLQQHSSATLKNYRILDIGSGLGGPARLLAKWIMMKGKQGCRSNVTALELQPDLHQLASQLTRQCGLEQAVTHIQGDFLTLPVVEKQSLFDAITSWLVFLHISDKAALLKRCHDCLQPDGGCMYVADFYQGNAGGADRPWTDAEVNSLRHDVFCDAESLPTAPKYQILLHQAGFELVQWTDQTEAWRVHVTNRHETYQAQLERHVQVHGHASATSLGEFYQAMHQLFQGGKICGVTYLVRRRRQREKEDD